LSPTQIANVTSFLNGNESLGLDVTGSYAYMACGLGGMAMIAISDPENMLLLPIKIMD